MSASLTSPSASPAGTRRILARTIVLVGMMGSGKSSVGRKLAARLALPFVDSDSEIEIAAGCTVQQFFARYGEAEFRAGERRVINRLLERPMMVLATGGGAFMNPETRDLIHDNATSVWLQVDAAILTQRIGRRHDRPMLHGYADPATGIKTILTERETTYAKAQITVPIGDQPIETTVDAVMQALQSYASIVSAENAKYLVIS
ncbi:MAG: shikimate kinase [Hyphomicrobium sp.]